MDVEISFSDGLVCVAMRGREHRKQHLEPQSTGRTNCLTSIQKDNLILHRAYGNNTRGIFEGKTPTLSTCAWEQNNLLSTLRCIRRLTPVECSRLQTVPSWYRWKCSDTQIYKMIGNDWTVDVIAHILSFMK